MKVKICFNYVSWRSKLESLRVSLREALEKGESFCLTLENDTELLAVIVEILKYCKEKKKDPYEVLEIVYLLDDKEIKAKITKEGIIPDICSKEIEKLLSDYVTLLQKIDTW